MNNLVESQIRGQTGGSGQYQYGKVQDLGLITCFRCHKKWYFQYNSPLVKNSGAISVNEEPSTALSYKIPKNGEPETKLVNDTTYNFCNKCGWWNSGGRWHSSDDQKTKEVMSKLKNSALKV